MQILINEQVNKEAWNKFVQKNPRGNIFQTNEFYEIYEKSKKLKPLLMVVMYDNHILAGLLAYVSAEKGGVLKSISSRAVIHGGPLFIDSEDGKKAISLLISEFDNKVRKKVIFSQIRNVYAISEINDLLKNEKYDYEPHLNFLIDLTKSKNELWNQMTKARRNGVTKSKRLDVTVEVVKSIKELPSCYELLKQTYTQAKLPLADISLFENAYEVLHPKKMLKIFVAKHEEKKIGVIMALLFKDAVYDWFAGASSEHLKLCPNDLLPWHVIEWASENNYKVFDFGGAGHPDKPYGVREFKRQYGGKEVNYGRYEKIYHETRLKIAKGGYSLWRKLIR
jgi:serine/alanine adding enzyme